MSRKIRRNRKENRFFTLQELRKRFPYDYDYDDDERGTEFPACNKIHCNQSNGTDTPCIAMVEYKHYSWGITKEGKAMFCCPDETFYEEDWDDGKRILTEYKPKLEAIIRKK